jgi:signal peptidase I
MKTKIKAALKEFGIIFGAFLVLNSFVVASFEVPTGSMENEIMTGDFLLVNKFVYGGTTPRTIPFTNIKIPAFKLPAFWHVERGDIIVFMFPGMRDEVEPAEFAYYLKRCIALPGDTLQIINRIVYVNGKPSPVPRNVKFNMSYIKPPDFVDPRIFPPGAKYNEDNYGPIVIPKKGDVISLGLDNIHAWNIFIRREGHSVNIQNGIIYIDGKETNQYIVEQDYVFGMGDNRDNSLDSRFWGFIPVKSIVGSPLIVYWSWDPDISLLNIGRKLSTVRWNRLGTLVH